jgi:cytoskeletal protein RodZ
VSTVQEPGSARPGRLLGLILIGVAVIATVLGVITLANGDTNGNNAGGGSSTRPPAPTSGSATNPPSSNNPSSPAPPPNTSTQPPATTTTGQPAPPPNNRSVPIRVLNNSKISGLASRAAAEFKADGWNVVFFGNYSQENVPTSTAYFHAGTPGEAAAKELAAKFALTTDTRFPPRMPDPGSGVVVIVTNDYGSK